MGKVIGNMEFYLLGNEIWYIGDDGSNKRVDEDNAELIAYILNKVSEFYPEAYNALSECYKKSSANVTYYQYLMVRRFIKCNFGALETTKHDVDNGSFNFEKTMCPMRGECKYEGIICFPKFNSKLSQAELRVMRLVYEGKWVDDIAEELFLSPNTIKNHIKSVYVKLGIHEKSEFIQYATKNNLFEL